MLKNIDVKSSVGEKLLLEKSWEKLLINLNVLN